MGTQYELKIRILVSVIVQKLTLPSVIVPSSSVARFCSTVCYCTSKQAIEKKKGLPCKSSTKFSERYVGLPYALLLEDISSFLTKKKIVLRGRQKNCQMPSFPTLRTVKNMSQHSPTKNFGKFQSKLRSADVMTCFLVFTASFLSRKNEHVRT